MKSFLLNIFTLLFLSVLSTSVIGQGSRTSIIRDVKKFQYSIYSNTLYPTTTYDLKWLIYKYCQKVGYNVATEDTAYIEFVKKINRPQSKTSLLNSYVYIDIHTANEFKKVTIKTREVQYKRPFTDYPSEVPNKIITTHDFNKREFYYYLYRFFNKEPVILPDKLQQRVEAYNTKQDKHSKKIIAGRDY